MCGWKVVRREVDSGVMLKVGNIYVVVGSLRLGGNRGRKIFKG